MKRLQHPWLRRLSFRVSAGLPAAFPVVTAIRQLIYSAFVRYMFDESFSYCSAGAYGAYKRACLSVKA
jgi:hypothetical protein